MSGGCEGPVTHDPFNAFLDRDPKAHSGQGPLAGLTAGIKANIMVKGLPWNAGMELHRTRIATRDAEVVARLRAAGAAILGTLNMDEAALGAKCDNPWFGQTQNPHRPGYTPGGSSGGSAAAVAGGLCDIALGTDTMGSVRIPASYCGIYGFKPANAAVSQQGLELTEPSLDVIGPLARDLDTLQRAARVISDFGEGECRATILGLANAGDVNPSPEIGMSYVKTCTDMGCELKEFLPHPLSRVRFAGFISVSRWLAEQLANADQSKLSPELTKLLTYGPKRSAAQWAEDHQILADTKAAMTLMVEDGSVLLLPAAPQTAFPHAEAAPANQADYTCLASVAGLPALALPAGWSAAGLPFGLQLIGKAGHEAGLFDTARRIETELGAYRRPAQFGY
jgi:aspartyl-tRNA(Asn)/glutamyl-tRNA(Gln) amidotransferase subunit A